MALLALNERVALVLNRPQFRVSARITLVEITGREVVRFRRVQPHGADEIRVVGERLIAKARLNQLQISHVEAIVPPGDLRVVQVQGNL